MREVKKLGTLSLEVPEWPDDNGNPLKIFWKPVSSKKVMKYADQKKGDTLARIIVENATDEDGNKLFSAGDHVTLAGKGNYKTVSKIANAILDQDGEDPDDDGEEDEDPLG